MSDLRTLADKLKAAPSVSGFSGGSLLITNANGGLSKAPISEFKLANLYKKESNGNVISLRDFTTKYIEGKYVGTILSDVVYSHAEAWYVRLKGELTINMQTYSVEIMKSSGSLTSSWCCITLLFRPSSPMAQYIYFVSQTTGATADTYSVSIKRVELESV